MAKRSKSLASMSVENLLKMRDDIGRVLSQKAEDLKQQLSRLSGGGGGGGPGRGGRRKRGSVKGRKVPPKYHGPGGETWAGRGARPRWMQERIKAGAKQEDFLIKKPGRAAASRKKRGRAAASRKKPGRLAASHKKPGRLAASHKKGAAKRTRKRKTG